MVLTDLYFDKYQYHDTRSRHHNPSAPRAHPATERTTQMTDQIHETVRASYAAAALTVLESRATAGASCCEGNCGCGPGDGATFGSELYSVLDKAELPGPAVLASLGCGNPIAIADLRPGEVVLDLGSGGGIDVLLSARRVGPAGKAYGLDMTEEMLALARKNAAEAGAENVEFLKGYIEAIPLPAGTVDVVISNCVINLAADKPAVFREIARVLKPGGRLGLTDVVAEDHLTPAERLERGSYAGCIAGALSFAEYRAGLAAAGLDGIEITPTHGVEQGMVSAIVKASKPAAQASKPAAQGSKPAAAAAGGGMASGEAPIGR
jgi:arsenite methyltransferase